MRARSIPGFLLLAAVLLAAVANLGWSARTTRYVAWSSVEFMPRDLARHVRRNHRRFDAGIDRGLAAPLPWRAGPPGKLVDALDAAVRRCSGDLARPVPLADLVEELGVLTVRILDANDPLAVGHGDPREGQYATAYRSYVDSILGRIRLVFYGQDRRLLQTRSVPDLVSRSLSRSRELYPNIGADFYRTGKLRDWRDFDDRSVAFGVAGVSLSRGLTDVANITGWVWHRGGGSLAQPLPTPVGHAGPTVVLAPRLEGGFDQEEKKPGRGKPAMGSGSLSLPPP